MKFTISLTGRFHMQNIGKVLRIYSTNKRIDILFSYFSL